jgi:hypothetical protein
MQERSDDALSVPYACVRHPFAVHRLHTTQEHALLGLEQGGTAYTNPASSLLHTVEPLPELLLAPAVLCVLACRIW